MKRVFGFLSASFLVLAFAFPACAAFIDIGGGMIYDDILGITWLQDANYAMTSGYDSDGLMTWDEAMAWAASLTVGGKGGWRLPTFDPNNARPPVPTSANEFGSLRTQLLSGVYNGNIYYDGTTYTPDVSPFYNLGVWDSANQVWDYVYWTGLAGTIGAWDIYLDCG